MKKTYLNTLKPEEVVKRLKNGEVIRFEGSTNTIKMIDGVIIKSYDTNTMYNTGFTVSELIDDYYFEEEEKFEITETGVYKRRDGKKAFVYEINEEADDKYFVCYILENDGECFSVTEQGRLNIYAEYPEDIVSKWED